MVLACGWLLGQCHIFPNFLDKAHGCIAGSSLCNRWRLRLCGQLSAGNTKIECTHFNFQFLFVGTSTWNRHGSPNLHEGGFNRRESKLLFISQNEEDAPFMTITSMTLAKVTFGLFCGWLAAKYPAKGAINPRSSQTSWRSVKRLGYRRTSQR